MPSLLNRIGAWLAGQPKKVSLRRYTGAASSRFSLGFGGGNSSADAELASALPLLRSRSRALMRDSAYAKRARTVIVNNVIGGGVGLQAQVLTTRGELAERVNEGIERAWREWSRSEHCHTGGVLHFSDLERAAMAEVVTAGECFIRRHFKEFGGSKVAYALELIEPERLLDSTVSTLAGVPGNVRMGVECDEWNRPVAYYIQARHPGDHRFGRTDESSKVVRVPAAEMFHLRLVDRWPQTRGEPWLHAILRKLDDMEQYSAAELQAAKASSYYFGTIETPEASPLTTVEAEGATPAAVEIESGLVQQLMPGEKLNFHSPSRPNTAIDPFLRHMLREVAAGAGVSYESLSRDYSQSNYSSSRLALLDDRDLWRMLQQWWVRNFREPLHREWMRQAVFGRGAIPEISLDAYYADPARYEAVKWKTRGWSWIDPAKEQKALADAVKSGFTTVTDVIAQTANGSDLEDVLKTRERELKLMEQYGIKVDTTVKDEPTKPAAAAPPPEPDDGQDDEEPTSRPARLVSFGGK